MIKSEMPIMRPVPIDTKGQTKYVQIKRWLFSTREWEIMQDWHFTLPNGVKVCIPAGFVFDGASVPRLCWGILSPTGILFIPSILHDHAFRKGYLWATSESGHRYQYGKLIERTGWDNLFFEVCKQVNGMKEVSWGAWFMLKCFGWIAWDNSVKLRGGPC